MPVRHTRYLDEGDPQRLLGHPAGDLIADPVNELMGDDEHQQVCILHSLAEVRDRNLKPGEEKNYSCICRKLFHSLLHY